MIATGTHDGELSWVITAQRRGPDMSSMIHVDDASGHRLFGGGTGGLPLDGGRLMNVSTGGGDSGPRYLLARVHPDIRSVQLVTTPGETLDVPVYDSADFSEVRFAALLIPRGLRLSWVAGMSDSGQELERFDLAFHERFWHRKDRD